MKWPSTRMEGESTRGFAMYNLARKLEQGGADIIHLEVGKPSFDTPLHIKEAAKKALDEGAVHYGDIPGYTPLRRAISGKLKSYNRIDASPDTEIVVTHGNTQAAFATYMAALDPGDEVLVLEPWYNSHNKRIRLAGGKVVPVQLKKENGFKIVREDVEASISPKSKAIELINPANPLGRVFSREELQTIADVAIKHDLLVVSDEVYEYILYDGHKHISIASLPQMHDRTITLFAFTKAYAMDGWRLGYAVARKEFMDTIKAVALAGTTQANEFAQRGALAAIEGSQDCVREMLMEDQRRRDLAVRRLNQMGGVACHNPEGSMYVFPDISAISKDSEKLVETIFEKTYVATSPGAEFGPHGEGHLRMCFGAVSYERLSEAMDRIQDCFKHL